MIYTRITGGIGNQLFNYTLGRYLAEKHKVELVLDISWFRQFPYRTYDLDRFNITGRIPTLYERAGLWQMRDTQPNKYNRVAKRFTKLLPHITYAREKSLHFDPTMLSLPDNTYIAGNWQSLNYFKDIEDIIRAELTLKTPSDYFAKVKQQMESCNSIALHVRRGDYAYTQKIKDSMGLCSPQYYQSAVEYIAARVPNSTIFVFSDDLPWVKANLSFAYPVIYIEHPEKKDYEEPLIMAAAKHQIISNSTFGWWGAWLNQNPGKIVCAPSKWLADDSQGQPDIVPSGWIRM